MYRNTLNYIILGIILRSRKLTLKIINKFTCLYSFQRYFQLSLVILFWFDNTIEFQFKYE